MMFGAIFIVLIACIGSGYDMNQLVSTKQKASSIADTAALTAAVYYSEHNEAPQTLSEGLVHNHEYDASALNFAFNSISNKMARNVKVKVLYDEVNKEVTTKVYGHTEAAFMQIFGHQNLSFEASSTAKFSEVQLKNPASIIMVLDNSGSMWFDDLPNDPSTGANPPHAKRRITALEQGVNSLMGSLRALGVDDLPAGERVLRTGMINYASSVLSGPGGSSVPMRWGTVTPTEVAAMTPGGGTNSDPPMAQAKVELDGEGVIHQAENGDGDPLKFLIFMTDGQNNNTSYSWEPNEGTGYWRKLIKPGGYERVCRWYWRGRCRSYRWQYSPAEYDYQSSEDEPAGGGWEEGMTTGNLDRLTHATCKSLREDNVKIYSIGFALESGSFDTNEWASTPGGYTPYSISPKVKEGAVYMMQQCSGKTYPERFSLAGDSASLEQAFQNIGQQIVAEVVRLSM